MQYSYHLPNDPKLMIIPSNYHFGAGNFSVQRTRKGSVRLYEAARGLSRASCLQDSCALTYDDVRLQILSCIVPLAHSEDFEFLIKVILHCVVVQFC